MTKPERVFILGCGIVGAMLAYELSKTPLQVAVLEAKSQPGQGATGASLGVLMAACSQKPRGDLVTLRLASLRAYDRLIPELIAQTGADIPYNRAGILCLYASADAVTKCQSLIPMRQEQGFSLHWLDAAELQVQYPHLNSEITIGGLYSPCDRALHPTKLVQALVRAAQSNGAKFEFNCPVTKLGDLPTADWIVITAGLGSDALLQLLQDRQGRKSDPHPLLAPVGGQAIKVDLPDLDLQPVIHAEDINGEDINIVPLGNGEYWVGATVEFNPADLPRDANIGLLLDRAAQFCSAFARASVLETWAGYRSRPNNRRSPILGFVPGCDRVLVATGHYRNGILMAPVTAQITRELIVDGSSPLPWQGFQIPST